MKISGEFIKYIEDNCFIDDVNGCIACNKCRHEVIIDWFEESLECQGCDEL